jgi:peptidyl-prolyl cis-trans isomerase B (cyclophilin B)
MKFIALVIALCIPAAALRAEDVAVVTVRFAREKKTERFVIELHEGDAPTTSANFKALARKGFYKGIRFHRVFPRTLVQAGDPLSRRKDRTKVGTGGPDYTLAPEIRRKHTAGAVAMSRLPDKINPGRRSSGSQFYICLQPMPNLDGQYTVLGNVISGIETVEKISTQPADSNDNPIDPIIIKSVKIMPREQAGS